MGVRENKVEKYLDKQITELGGLTRKWTSPGRDGVPDRICIVPVKVAHMIELLNKMDPDSMTAMFTLVEVKVVDGRLSSVQKREHDRLRDVGADVVTVHGENEVDQWVTKSIQKIMTI